MKMLSSNRFLLLLALLLLLSNRPVHCAKRGQTDVDLKDLVGDDAAVVAAADHHTSLMGKMFPILSSIFGR
jgi:hypothetical protein